MQHFGWSVDMNEVQQQSNQPTNQTNPPCRSSCWRYWALPCQATMPMTFAVTLLGAPRDCCLLWAGAGGSMVSPSQNVYLFRRLRGNQYHLWIIYYNFWMVNGNSPVYYTDGLWPNRYSTSTRAAIWCGDSLALHSCSLIGLQNPSNSMPTAWLMFLQSSSHWKNGQRWKRGVSNSMVGVGFKQRKKKYKSN